METTGSGGGERQVSQLVVVGASAGGVDALLTLVAALPADLPAPVVVAQHLDPTRTSRLGELLAGRSTLPVRTVRDSEPLANGVVYVVPADRDVEITDHHVGARPSSATAPKPSVDLLLASAARLFTENLIAVVLTGLGSDGAIGAQAVKAHGGTVVVQNPETASFPAMPLAVAPSSVDVVADIEAIGPLLGDLLGGANAVPSDDGDAELPAFLDRVRERSGLDFSAYKRPTIVRRLRRRMAAVGAATLPEYRRHAEQHPEEMQRLVAGFLIKVTEFFRDPELFAYLRDAVLPTLIDEARERGELRLWSAGCATGEEAYTLAMLVTDLLGGEIESLPVRIFATDVAADAVDFARRGVYPGSALDGLPPELVDRHFVRIDGSYEVRKSVRGLVVFGEHDLGHRAPFPRIDLVLCRNVLIYFTPELQRRALHLFAYSLRRGGFLALGKAETASPLPEFYALEQGRLKVFRRVGEPAPIPSTRLLDVAPLTTGGQRPVRRVPGPRQLAPPRPPVREPSLAQQATRLLDRSPMGVVTVERDYHIRTINGAARRLLGIHAASVGDDLIHRVPPSLVGPLRVGLDAAFRGETTTTPCRIDDDVAEDGGLDLVVVCYPSEPDGVAEGTSLAVVAVEDVTPMARRERALEADRARLAEELERQTGLATRAVAEVRELRQANLALAAANTRLRTESEELVVANEEAQAAAEEIETLNEELQATNEELETLNEELQATVEELTSTNDELQARSVELEDSARSLGDERRVSEADRHRLEEILRQAPSGMMVFDGPGHVYRFSNAAGLRFIGRSEDEVVGRSFAEVHPEMVPQGVVARMDEVYASGDPYVGDEVRIRHDRDRDGESEEHFYDLVIQPLRSNAGQIDAILNQSVDVTERVRTRRRLEEVLQQAEVERSQLAAILAEMGDAVFVLDADGALVRSNATFDRLFGGPDFVPEDDLGRPLPAAEWPQQRAIRGETFMLPFTLSDGDGGRRWFEAQGQPVVVDGAVRWCVVVIRDITERSLRRLQDEFIAVAGHELRTPLTALSGSLQLLVRRLAKPDADDRMRQQAARALDQVRRLEVHVTDLMDVARLQSGKFALRREPTDLAAVVRQAVETAQPMADGQRVEVELPDAPVTVDGDGWRLEQVVLNLLSNAFAHAPNTDRIEVRLRQEDGAAVVEVEDYGEGIAEGNVPNIFGRFFQGEEGGPPRGGGLGLGLFIAQEIVEAHGGTIGVRSTVGEGTTFAIRLPLPAAAAASPDEP